MQKETLNITVRDMQNKPTPRFTNLTQRKISCQNEIKPNPKLTKIQGKKKIFYIIDGNVN